MITDHKEHVLFAHIASQQLAALIIAFPAWEAKSHIDEALTYAAMMIDALNKQYQ